MTHDDRRLAASIHRGFAQKPGADHIASEFALAHLCACLRLSPPAFVLELGAGIGTVTKCLLAHPCGVEKIVATEDNAFCLEQLERNLAEVRNERLDVVTDLETLTAKAVEYDLVICDGGFGDTRQFGGLRLGTQCYFEGNRRLERGALQGYVEAMGHRLMLANYHRGRRLRIRPGREMLGVRLPKVKIAYVKGCWIGDVS